MKHTQRKWIRDGGKRKGKRRRSRRENDFGLFDVAMNSVRFGLVNIERARYETFHLVFELNCDSFWKHFIMLIHLLLAMCVCICYSFAFWYRFVLSCSAFIFIHSHVGIYFQWAYFRSISGYCCSDITRPLTQSNFFLYIQVHTIHVCECRYAFLHIISTLAHCIVYNIAISPENQNVIRINKYVKAVIICWSFLQ